MAENYKNLYAQMKKMVEQYQDEIVPGLRKIAEELGQRQAASSWISVKDRLPEGGKCVLVYSQDGGVAEGKYNARFKEWVQFRWSVTDLKNVTHWMPLPEPPKEE